MQEGEEGEITHTRLTQIRPPPRRLRHELLRRRRDTEPNRWCRPRLLRLQWCERGLLRDGWDGRRRALTEADGRGLEAGPLRLQGWREEGVDTSCLWVEWPGGREGLRDAGGLVGEGLEGLSWGIREGTCVLVDEGLLGQLRLEACLLWLLEWRESCLHGLLRGSKLVGSCRLVYDTILLELIETRILLSEASLHRLHWLLAEVRVHALLAQIL